MKFIRKIKFYFIKWLIGLSLWKNGIQIEKVMTEEKLNQARHFTWQIYAIQKKYIDADLFPQKIFEDEFDKYSIYFLAFNRKKKLGL